jgi:deazaflavin-dependent oxidoreductase (nitroreductase family)
VEKRFEGLRQFAAHKLNPIVLRFAGARYSPFAALCHVGRRSGKPYKTPLVVRSAKGGFVLPMPYGTRVDWYRNMVAAGGSTLLLHGREYTLAKPLPLTARAGLAAFALPQRFILRWFGVNDFALAPVTQTKGR